jgi:catalase
LLAHSKGILLTGTFIPTTAARELLSAPHFSASSTPVTVRFSSSTGIPVIPDIDPNGDPRGFAIRFHLLEKNGRRVHTDIVAHSVPLFPTRTGEEFVELLHALIATASSKDSPSPLERFLGSHPPVLTWVQFPKPTPKSLAQQQYWGVNAFNFINNEGENTYVRYHITPDAGVAVYDTEGVKSQSDNFLSEDLISRVQSKPVSFRISVQVAEEGGQTDDATVHWPESRKVVELGTVSLDKIVEHDKQPGEQKKIIFDPITRVQGIKASADPLLEMRAGAYIISGQQRRAAKDAPTGGDAARQRS